MLYDPVGNRKYLTADERRRFIEAARRQPAHIETFCLAMAYSGARISEILSLRVGSIDQSAGIIVIESLKKRRKGVYRHVPVPPRLLQRLHEIQDRKRTRLNSSPYCASRMLSPA